MIGIIFIAVAIALSAGSIGASILFALSYAARSLRWALLSSGGARDMCLSHRSYDLYVLPALIAEPLRAKRLGRPAGQAVAWMAWERALDAMTFAGIAAMLIGGSIIGIVSGVSILLVAWALSKVKINLKFFRDLRSAKPPGIEKIVASVALTTVFWLLQLWAGEAIIGHGTMKLMATALAVSFAVPIPMGLGAMEAVFMTKMPFIKALESAMAYRLSMFGTQFFLSWLMKKPCQNKEKGTS